MEPYFQDQLTSLYLGDDVDVLSELPDKSVELVFTSPPYNLGGEQGGFATPGSGNATGKWGGGKLASGYGNHNDNLPHDVYVAWQRRVLAMLWEKITEDGAIYYNHKPRLKNKELWLPLELNPGLPIRQIVIWKRAGGVNFSPTHFVPTYEWIMILAKPDYRLKSRGISGLGDVWEVPEDKTGDNLHPAPFPVGLPARAIEASNGIKTVLDPYVGSGSTMRAAADAGLQSIGIDNDQWCLDLTVDRLAQQSFGF